MTWEIRQGDALDVLRQMPDQSAQCCVTSPPYWGLRDYGIDGQLGLERTPGEYVARLVTIFAEVRRVLRDDGTLWLNLGDSYAANRSYQVSDSKHLAHDFARSNALAVPAGLKPKDLVGIPWRVAFALQADGWYLRSDIIWHKPNPMPESVTDRPTKAHEYIFLLAKSARYYYDADAIRDEWADSRHGASGARSHPYLESIGRQTGATTLASGPKVRGRNRRSVWTVTTQPFPGAHFATFPPKLIEPCILAGCPAGGVVLDPFTGAGTTAMVALRHGRGFVGIELNPEYCEMARRRIEDDGPLLNVPAEGTVGRE